MGCARRVGLALLLLVACAVAVMPPARAAAQTPTRDVIDTLLATGDFATFARLLQTAGLIDTLKGDGPFTLFAPNDAAFNRFPQGTLAALVADPPRLRAMLAYHVVTGRYLGADLFRLTTLPTLQGAALPVDSTGGTLRVGGAAVTQTDLLATNGVVHLVDTVLMPPQLLPTATAPPAATTPPSAPAATATASLAAAGVAQPLPTATPTNPLPRSGEAPPLPVTGTALAAAALLAAGLLLRRPR